MTDRTAKQIFTLLRIALGAVFVYAGVVKIIDPVAFAGHIAAYKILPYFGNYLVAATLPWIEAICGILLIVGWRTRSAAILIAGLNLVFMAALLSTILRGLDIDCGCFRQGGEKTSAWTALFRDIILFIVAVFVARGHRRD